MGLFRKIRSIFHENWCNLCQSEMDVLHKQLYALPDLTVGHYSSHENPEYYLKHLVPVEKKAQIPAGIYACGLHSYRCPQCENRRVQLTIFLPVREEEKTEEILFFDHGELDGLIYQQDCARADVKQKNRRRQDSYECKQGGFYDYE
ncbi:hypothetical protein E5329_04525 [Petralouisia muris]|uniref:Uncharacterized protein n=1 Tax=Petralouisia muris TaxID=3032872 RepID=A0AC61RZG6_9FIRM|nr:hypothetical protein [Petralouisia muris]TGY97415.1 hypothetical protein E5329_04525 [Petralouisia muris]